MDNGTQQNPNSLTEAIEQLEQHLRHLRDDEADLLALATGGAPPSAAPRVVPFPGAVNGRWEKAPATPC